MTYEEERLLYYKIQQDINFLTKINVIDYNLYVAVG